MVGVCTGCVVKHCPHPVLWGDSCAELCMQAARLSALKALKANGGTMPAYPGMRRRIPSSARLVDQAVSATNSPSRAGEGSFHGPH